MGDEAERKEGEQDQQPQYVTKKDLESLQSQMFGAVKRFVREGLAEFKPNTEDQQQQSQQQSEEKGENDEMVKRLQETETQLKSQQEALEKRERMLIQERKRNAVLGGLKDLDLMPGVADDYQDTLSNKVQVDPETGETYWPAKQKDEFGDEKDIRLPVADGVKTFFGERKHLLKAKVGGDQRQISKPEKYSDLIEDPKALAHWQKEDPQMVERLRGKESPGFTSRRWGDKK